MKEQKKDERKALSQEHVTKGEKKEKMPWGARNAFSGERLFTF
jgi:hypothetical protein